MNYCSLLLALLLPLGGISQIQFVSFQPHKSSSSREGHCTQFILTFEVAQGYHIQANTPLADHLIPKGVGV